jgi:RNA recognition motif-containing protein
VDVRYVNLPRDRESGKIKGFAFVDVGSADQIPKAIEALNGIEVGDRPLRVSRYLAKDQIRSSKSGTLEHVFRITVTHKQPTLTFQAHDHETSHFN